MDEENGKQPAPDDSFRRVQQEFFDLCANIKNIPIEKVPPKQIFPRSKGEKLRLRPSVVDRAIAKKSVVSSTPMTHQEKTFIPESNVSMSPIADSVRLRNHKTPEATARLHFSDNTNPISISSSVDQNYNQSVEDVKRKKLDQIVSNLRFNSLISEGIQAGSLNTTTKTVQTSHRSISDVKKLGRNFTTQIVKERQTQTGISLDKNFIQKIDIPPSPTASETDFILGARTRNRLISYSHKGSDSEESTDGIPSVCVDVPWRAPSGLQDHFEPARDTFMPIDSMEDSCCDDTFRPQPPKQKRVFTNKGKENKVNKNILPNNEKIHFTDPVEACTLENGQGHRVQNEASKKNKSSTTQTNTKKNSVLNKTRKRVKESVAKKSRVTSDSSCIQPPEDIETSTRAKILRSPKKARTERQTEDSLNYSSCIQPPEDIETSTRAKTLRSPKKARTERQTEDSLNCTQAKADLNQKVCKEVRKNKQQMQDSSLQDGEEPISNSRRNPVEVHDLRDNRPNHLITSQLNQTELRETSKLSGRRTRTEHPMDPVEKGRKDRLQSEEIEESNSYATQRNKKKNSGTLNSMLNKTPKHIIESLVKKIKVTSDSSCIQPPEDIETSTRAKPPRSPKKKRTKRQTENSLNRTRPKADLDQKVCKEVRKNKQQMQDNSLQETELRETSTLSRRRTRTDTRHNADLDQNVCKEVPKNKQQDNSLQYDEEPDSASRINPVELDDLHDNQSNHLVTSQLNQTELREESGFLRTRTRTGTQNSSVTSQLTVSVQKNPKTKPGRASKKVVDDVFEDDDLRLNRTKQKGESLSQPLSPRGPGRSKKRERDANKNSNCERSITEVVTNSKKKDNLDKQVSPSKQLKSCFKKPQAASIGSSPEPQGETSDALEGSQTLKRRSPKKRQVSTRLTDLGQGVPISQDQLNSLLSTQTNTSSKSNSTINISQDGDLPRRSTRQRRQAPLRSAGVVLIRSSASYKQFIAAPPPTVGKYGRSRTTSILPSIQEIENEADLEPEPDGLPQTLERESQEQHSSTSNRSTENIKSKNLVNSGRVTKKENKKANNRKMLSVVKNINNESKDEMNDVFNIYDDKKVRTLKWLFKNPGFTKVKGMSGVSTAIDSGLPVGLLKIDGGKQKPRQCTLNHQLSFYVAEGQGDVSVQDKSSLVNKHDLFIVPAGSEYCIKNCSAHEDLILSFTKFPSVQ